ncbi:putative NBD/HSP70 family sugar kinase [Labedella gwakjiensis]|uniref:Putative NBD/HSP70 family sugar kinase n=1 Tax=Labedella gwakjiensis TaxID=390269 RepID=A0A2P8GT42_9MICO|nr:ROK family transcriptional regulator [Labedella gwakjiensis]PSL37139.1 putative NBD/HSP70 family sugar kinase [Labedella gwakjiensis]RUQ81959.1 ROK family transcriptional regulator [Labedella gwakjiensis]
MRKGHNLLAVGDYNQAVILDLIRRAHLGLSRVEIAVETGLSAQTVSNVARRLLDAGLVREAGKLIAGPGKPRTLLQLEATSRYAVGVHLDPTVVTFVLLDLAGAIVSDHRIPTPSAADPDVVIAVMAEEIRALLERESVPPERVLGVGIAAPGPLDSTRGILLDPPLLEGWMEVPLRDALADATGFPVVLEKDVTAAAVAELWVDSGTHRDNFAFLYYGTGLGIGLVVNHDVLRGASDNAGDMGHLMVQADGPLCSCGRRGCVGDLVVPHRLVQRATAAGVLGRSAPLDGSVDGPVEHIDFDATDRRFSDFARAAADGDAAAVAILEEAATHLARALVSIVNLLDVDHVVCGGPFWRRIAPVMRERVERLVAEDPALIPSHPIVVENSTIGEDVAAVGAGCLVLDQTLSPRPSALLIAG